MRQSFLFLPRNRRRAKIRIKETADIDSSGSSRFCLSYLAGRTKKSLLSLWVYGDGFYLGDPVGLIGFTYFFLAPDQAEGIAILWIIQLPFLFKG